MKKVLIGIVTIIILCSLTFVFIRKVFFNKTSIDTPINTIFEYFKKDVKEASYIEATTKPYEEETSVLNSKETNYVDDDTDEEEDTKYPYSNAPKYVDDGSIIYEGKTLTELTNQLNKSLKGYLTNTGIFFAEFTKDTGLDPYLAVSITLLETGCNWQCSTLTRECNNIGGLKGSGSCNGGSYSKYDTLEQGITAYLNIIYNNYYLKGMKTPEQMNPVYAASSQWANKVNNYIESVRNK